MSGHTAISAAKRQLRSDPQPGRCEVGVAGTRKTRGPSVAMICFQKFWQNSVGNKPRCARNFPWKLILLDAIQSYSNFNEPCITLDSSFKLHLSLKFQFTETLWTLALYQSINHAWITANRISHRQFFWSNFCNFYKFFPEICFVSHSCFCLALVLALSFSLSRIHSFTLETSLLTFLCKVRVFSVNVTENDCNALCWRCHGISQFSLILQKQGISVQYCWGKRKNVSHSQTSNIWLPFPIWSIRHAHAHVCVVV